VPQRPQRSLAVVGVLALGDYLLWNWSIGANHDVVALVSGMTLIPLLIALAWLLLVAAARLIGHVAQRPKASAAVARAAATDAATATATTGVPHPPPGDPTPAAVGSTAVASPSSKLAA
jgi:type II secretory pathway pseudopilin PulG